VGTVCLAEDPILGRRVLVKIFPMSNHRGAAELDGERFLQRARRIARLEHPYLVPVFDCGRCEEGLFFVFPLQEGRTLEEELEGGRVSPEELLEIGARIAEALDHCAARGVVHGDVQARNILLRREDGHLRVWLKEFAVLPGPERDAEGDTRALLRLLQDALCTASRRVVSERDWQRLLHPLVRVRDALPGLAEGLRGVVTRRLSGILRSAPGEPPLLGRDRERSVLLERLEQSLAGRSQLVLVTGEPGIGKSRLVAELVQSAEESKGALFCVPGPPVNGGCRVLGGFRRLLEEHAFELDLPETQEAPERRQCVEILARALLRLGDSRPTVFLLEGLHRDPAAAAVLEDLLRRLGSAPFLFVATVRTPLVGGPPELVRLLRELPDEPRGTVIELGPLGVEVFGELLSTWLGAEVPEHRVQEIHEAAAGNPLLGRELVRSLSPRHRDRWLGSATPGDLFEYLVSWPESVFELVERQLSSLPRSCRELLEAASILPSRFERRDLEALLEDSETAEQALDMVCRAGLLKPRRGSLTFASGVVARVVRGTLPEGVRRRLEERHRALGEVRRKRSLRLKAHLAETGEGMARPE
jgi:tRNA A-37 threonylcarbamoyl transferase component Bud32